MVAEYPSCFQPKELRTHPARNPRNIHPRTMATSLVPMIPSRNLRRKALRTFNAQVAHSTHVSGKSAAQLLVGCRIEKDLSHLDLPPSGGDAFARPCHCLVHVSAFQYPKTADVFLGLKVRPVGDEDSAIGLRSQRLRGPKAASEFPDAGSNHLFVERVDLADRRFVRLGRVEVVG